MFLLEATSIVRGHKWIEDPVFDRNTTAMQKNLKNFQRSLTPLEQFYHLSITIVLVIHYSIGIKKV